MEQVHAILYDQLNTIHCVCVNSGIKYWLIGGNLLGQVRGELLSPKYQPGIIPWDDDIDIGVNVADGEKLKKLLVEEFAKKKEYYIINSEHGYKVSCYGKKGIGTDIFLYKPVSMYPHQSLIGYQRELVNDDVTIWILNSETSRKAWPRDFFLAEEILNLRCVKFGPTVAMIPGVPLRYLYTVYGKDCMEVGKRDFNHLENKKHDDAGVTFKL